MWEYFSEEGKLFKIQIFEMIFQKCEGKCPVKKRREIKLFNSSNQTYKIYNIKNIYLKIFKYLILYILILILKI